VSFESVPFAEGANGQGPAVASVVNRYYLHSQYSGTHYGMYSSSSVLLARHLPKGAWSNSVCKIFHRPN
jgi:hypothetical protein